MKQKMQTPRVAVIGAGQWGQNLVATFHALGALAAVVEVNPALREVLATRFPGVPLHEDPAAVLASDIPAVAIATPAPTHHEVARLALESGKDVFVEKPMTLATAEAEDLVRVAQARDQILMVGHLLLYQPCVRWIKKAIDEGRIGRVLSLTQERLNLGRARAVENVLWSFGVHDIAVLLHLVGRPPSSLQVFGQRALRPGIEDDVHLHMDFGGGLVAHLHASWLWPGNRRTLTEVGSERMLVYDEVAQAVTSHRKGIDSALAVWSQGEEVAHTGSGEPLRLELEHFLTCVGTRRRPLSDGASGTEVVRVLERSMALMETRGAAALADGSAA